MEKGLLLFLHSITKDLTMSFFKMSEIFIECVFITIALQ